MANLVKVLNYLAKALCEDNLRFVIFANRYGIVWPREIVRGKVKAQMIGLGSRSWSCENGETAGSSE